MNRLPVDELQWMLLMKKVINHFHSFPLLEVKTVNYEFQNVVLLRRAMTHSSYSLENKKEFNILGERLIETNVALRSLTKDIDISLRDLNGKISEVSDVDTSCAADGMQLGLQNIVRVPSSTDSSTSSIVCDAF
ncbi:protein nuclear fusion defective 2, partial [Tanacetum coccineum]